MDQVGEKKCPFCGTVGAHDCPYQFRWHKDYLNLPRSPQKWIVQDLMPVGGIVNVFAKPKIGKTFMLLGIAQAVCNGDTEWEGFEVFQQGKVAFLQCDTPREEMADRLIKMITNEETFAIADMWQVPQYPFNILDPKNIQWLKQEMERIKPVIVIIDTIREVHEEDENESTGMRKVLGQIIGACRPATIVLISHQRKDGNNLFQTGAESDIMDENRGSSYIAGKADVVIRLTKKRMTYRGRATAQHSLPIFQDDDGFIHVNHDDDENTKIAKQLLAEHPGESVNSLAMRMAKMCKISVSTATRRLREVKK